MGDKSNDTDPDEADLIDIARLDAWIGDQLPGHGQPVTAERSGAATGIANALYRRPPR